MNGPEIREIRGVAGFQVGGWPDLAFNHPSSSYFQSPEWACAWWDTLAGRPPTRIATWHDDSGSLAAVATMSRVSERLQRLLPLPIRYWSNSGSGVGAADHVGPLADETQAPAVRAWIESLSGSVMLRNVAPGSSTVPGGAAPGATTACPRLVIPPGDEPIGRSAKYRKRLRRNSRVLREKGIEFEAVAGPDITSDMVNRLMSLHEARSDDKGWGSTFTPERVEFHRRLIGAARPDRGPGMMLARHQGEIVGVLYGFWWNSSFSYFQTGWDPKWWELSLGSALVYEMVMHARARGATLFDFLRGPEEYKYRFGALDQLDEDWLLARGVSGMLLKAKARLR